jgi:enoyl-CoA hydratase/carnithine racemase
MSSNFILSETRDRIATVTLNRPDRMNALSDEMVTELWAAMEAAVQDKEVRVVVLTGAGKGFCAGADVSGFGGVDPQYLIRKLPRLFDMNRRPDYQTRHSLFPAFGKPIIGMLNGSAAGLGLLYALFCDIRFAAEEAVFTTAFVRRGLSAEYGLAWILTQIVGQAHALDLLLSGRKVTAAEACRIGLVNQVYPRDKLTEATYAYAQEMAVNCSPRAMRIIKSQVYDVPFQTLAEAVAVANQDMLISNASPDIKEGAAAFFERRPPNFKDE